ncbi:MAG: DUF1150 family protein [Alphaproteobacteria bacterium]
MNTNTNHERPGMSAEMFAALGGPNLVYVRAVEPKDLTGTVPEDVLAGAERFYALHAADGTRVAVLSDREAAFITARQHDMVPVSVH